MKERLQAWGDTAILPIVGAFAFNESGELLLLQRHSDDLGGGQWGTPGGRIDAGETADEAIAREFFEETGIQGVNFCLLGSHIIRMPHGTVHMVSFKAELPKNAKIVLDPEEHHAYAWFKPEGLVDEDNILWGIPSILCDYKLIGAGETDPTLADGSSVKLVKRAR